MVRVRYSEFKEAKEIISYLDYYWEFYGKTNPKIYKRFRRLVALYKNQNIEEEYSEIKQSKLTATVKLTQKQFALLEKLVRLTNTLENLSKNKGK